MNDSITVAPVANLSALPPGRPRIEAAIRRWEEARHREARAAELVNEPAPRRLNAHDGPLTAWYENQFEALREATAEVVQRLREVGLRGLVLDGLSYLDVSSDLDTIDFDDEDTRWRIAVVPLGKVDSFPA